MDVIIDSCVLGSSQHLLVGEGGYTRLNKISQSQEAWHCSGEQKQASSACWDTLAFLHDASKCPAPEQKFVSAMKLLAPESSAIPWSSVLPQSSYRSYLDMLVEFCKKDIDESTVEYYKNIWRPGSHLLSMLRPAKVDGQLVTSNITSAHSGSAVSTFQPRAGGFAQPVVYDRFGTATGRMIVSSGPNILHLKKEHRNVIKSSFQDGKIAYVDFSSLEARILLYESGGRCDDADLYSYIASQVGGNISRSIVKTAVLSELYGSSRNALALKLGLSDESLSSFIRKIDEVINTKQLLRKLKSQVSSGGIITNKYGRKIKVASPQDNILINYYAQSTGVDVALVGFDKVINDLGQDGIRPLFVLHDALILDVRPDRIEEVESLSSIQVPGYEQKFYLKSEIIR